MDVDIIIIGGGIAGVSAGFELADDHTVLILEMESTPGYHSTGRSAAVYTELYGNALVRQLTKLSKPFFQSPPEGFSDYELLIKRPTIFIGRPNQMTLLEKELKANEGSGLIERKDADELIQAHPLLRKEYVAAGLLERGSSDMDVNNIHMGYLRLMKQRGGKLLTNTKAESATSTPDGWVIKTENDEFSCKWLINAAGAWAEKIGLDTGAPKIGLVPKKRTAFLFEPQEDWDVESWPMIFDIGEEFYFKPDAGKILGSPCDASPTAPHDARPDDLDVAIGVDRVQNAGKFDIRKISHKWAGLRSFVADQSPVVGSDPKLKNFFWLAGQGGYGIMTAPAMAACCASLIRTGDLPQHVKDAGVTKAMLSPDRLS